MTFLIAYELKGQRLDCREFFARLHALGECRAIMSNVVVLYVNGNIKTYTVNDLSDILTRGFTDSDRLIIFNVTGKRPNGLLTSEEWVWLNSKIESK